MIRTLRATRQLLCGAVIFFLALEAYAEERIVAYVPNWVDLLSFAETIDYAKVTHLNVAFENPTNDHGDLSFDAKDEALLAKGREHGVPVLVSIGGGSASEDRKLRARYTSLLAAPNRARFVAGLRDYVIRHGFAGLDVDLEGPAIDASYGAFIADLAVALKSKDKLLTAAISQGYGGDKVPESVFAHFDFVNVMAYDAAGPWNPKGPGQHSSLEFAKKNVSYWLARGLPRQKAVLGVPFYGYGFGAAFRKDEYPYKKIVAAYPGAEQLDQAGETIWYNGLPTIRAKAAYAKEEGLGGVMIWSLDSDAPGEKSLLGAIHEALRRAP
jgi:GH18 family chitinase